MGPKGSFPASAPELDTLLFDLDGTLVRMNQRGLELRFMARAVFRFGRVIRPWRYRKAFWEAAERMQHHGTSEPNYEVFLATLGKYASCGRDELDRIVHTSLEEDFGRLGGHFGPIPGARETLLLAKELGHRVVLATNPVWPLLGVKMRLAWGGLAEFPFDLITSSETMSRCKPSPDYYRALLERLGVDGARCLMVGNDPKKDLPAKDVGCLTYLVELPETKDIIERHRADPRLDGWGTYAELQDWLRRAAEVR